MALFILTHIDTGIRVAVAAWFIMALYTLTQKRK